MLPVAAVFVFSRALFLWGQEQAPLDPWLKRTAATGLALSLIMMVLGAANVPIILALWVLYHTLANVGQHWWVSVCFDVDIVPGGILHTCLCLVRKLLHHAVVANDTWASYSIDLLRPQVVSRTHA